MNEIKILTSEKSSLKIQISKIEEETHFKAKNIEEDSILAINKSNNELIMAKNKLVEKEEKIAKLKNEVETLTKKNALNEIGKEEFSYFQISIKDIGTCKKTQN